MAGLPLGNAAYILNQPNGSSIAVMTTMDSSHAGPILIAEDDRNIASLVRTYLEQAGFSVLVAHDGRAALELARSRRPIFVILDWMLPGMEGTEICRELRKTSDVPILMLTARGDETDRIVGFAVGADDYVVKPFSPRELVERVKAILRRAGWRDAEPSRVLGLGGLLVEPEKHKVTLGGRPVQLTPSEYKLLQALASHPGRVFCATNCSAGSTPTATWWTGSSTCISASCARRSKPIRPIPPSS